MKQIVQNYLWITGPNENELLWSDRTGHPLPWILRHGKTYPRAGTPDVFDFAGRSQQFKDGLRHFLLAADPRRANEPFPFYLPGGVGGRVIVFDRAMLNELKSLESLEIELLNTVNEGDLAVHGWRYSIPKERSDLALYESLHDVLRIDTLDDRTLLESLCKKFPVNTSEWKLTSYFPPILLGGKAIGPSRPTDVMLEFNRDSQLLTLLGRTQLSSESLSDHPIIRFHGLLVKDSLRSVFAKCIDDTATFGIRTIPVTIVISGNDQ